MHRRTSALLVAPVLAVAATGVLLPTAAPAVAGVAPAVPGLQAVAGGGVGDGGPAAVAYLHAVGRPAVLHEDPASPASPTAVLVADPDNDSVRRIDLRTGIVDRVAGSGVEASTGDGGPARSAALDSPTAVAAAPDGGFWLLESDGTRVRRVDPGGRIHTVAGTGSRYDVNPAQTDPLRAAVHVQGVAATPDGGLLLAGHGLVRRLTADGRLVHVAGAPAASSSPSGDGGPATGAGLTSALDAVQVADGSTWVLDERAEQVRRVDQATGLISTVLSGQRLFSLTVQSSGEAALQTPTGVIAVDAAGRTRVLHEGVLPSSRAAVAADGSLWSAGGRLFRTSPGGGDDVVAGVSNPFLGGEGQPATSSRVLPRGAVLDREGRLHLSAGGVVRRVELDGTLRTLPASGELPAGTVGGVQLAVADDGVVAVISPEAVALLESGHRRLLPVQPLGQFRGGAFDRQGRLLLSDSGGRLLQVERDGAWTVVAGNGTADHRTPAVGDVARTVPMMPSDRPVVTSTGDVWVPLYPFTSVRLSGGRVAQVETRVWGALAVDARDRLLGEAHNRTVLRIDGPHAQRVVLGQVGDRAVVHGQLPMPTRALLVAPDGGVLVADDDRVYRLPPPTDVPVPAVTGVQVDAPARSLSWTPLPAGHRLRTAVKVGSTAPAALWDRSGDLVARSTGPTTATLFDPAGIPPERAHSALLVVEGPDGSLSEGAVVPMVPAPASARYTPVAPQRFLDTRTGTGAASGPVTRSVTLWLPQSVPVDAAGVVLNVSAVDPRGNGYLRLSPAGTAPTATALNYGAGRSSTVLAVTEGDSNRRITLTVGGAATHLVADVVGYYDRAPGDGGQWQETQPQRFVDTRGGLGAPRGRTGGALVVTLPPSVPRDVRAAMLNVSVVDTERPGYLRLSAAGASTATTALNVGARQSMTALALTAVRDGKVELSLQGTTGHVVVDLVGWYTGTAPAQPAGFSTVSPSRFVDTRASLGAAPGSRTVTVAVPDSVPVGARNVVLNVSVVAPSGSGYLRLSAAGSTPTTTALNYSAGQSQTALAVTPVSPDRRITLQLHGGATEVVVDLVGHHGIPE